jgi:DNA invertase Pin-like site-specific DNA recombinase
MIARGQWAEISRWLQGNGIDLAGVYWFIDIGESGDKLERPPFNQLQAAIFTGAVGTVVVYKFDRLSRPLGDGVNVLCKCKETDMTISLLLKFISKMITKFTSTARMRHGSTETSW